MPIDNRDMRIETAMVVDDDASTLLIVRKLLNDAGVANVECFDNVADASQALEQAERHPDLLLIDLQMPDTDGVEFIRYLAELGCTSKIAILSSASSSVISLVRQTATSRNLKVVGEIAKPPTGEQVQAVLQAASRYMGAERHKTLMLKYSADDVREAIRSAQMVVYLQPQITIEDSKIDSAEALVRWIHPDDGIVAPVLFLPIVEENGLDNMLTECVVNHVLEAIQYIKHETGEDLRISINFNIDSLSEISWPDRLREMLAATGLSPSSIMVEVTESRVLTESPDTLDTLSRLRLMGIELSIDDFGTGYSTMNMLSKLPFTELKIDRRFVADSEFDPKSLAIVRNSISLANELDLKTVAEGIESESDLERMRNLGADIAQGYYFAKPMPVEAFVEWLKAHSEP